MFFAFGLVGLSVVMAAATAEPLPDIETRQFKVMPVEKSRTGRIYRFKTETQDLPQPGRIILIEENQKPVMAFRVLKSETQNNEFIGKRVRRYDTEGELKINERYDGVEKVAELIAAPPPEPTTWDPNAKPELDPLAKIQAKPEEGATSANPLATGTTTSPEPDKINAPRVSGDQTTPIDSYDDELDGGTSPQNLKKKEIEGDAIDDFTQDSKTSSEVDEIHAINPFENLISVSIGSYKNMSNFRIASPSSANGFGINFSHIADRGLFMRGKKPQDSLSVEYALEYYTRVNYTGNNDDYTLMPLKLQLRYDMHFSESFTYFLYLGAQYNWIMSTSNVNTTIADVNDAYNQLHGFQHTLGMGAFFQIGPQWYLRADLGWDTLALGLAVRW